MIIQRLNKSLLEEEYAIKLTGKQLLALWRLSWSKEGGDEFPKGKYPFGENNEPGQPRLFEVIEDDLNLSQEVLESLVEELSLKQDSDSDFAIRHQWVSWRS